MRPNLVEERLFHFSGDLFYPPSYFDEAQKVVGRELVRDRTPGHNQVPFASTLQQRLESCGASSLTEREEDVMPSTRDGPLPEGTRDEEDGTPRQDGRQMVDDDEEEEEPVTKVVGVPGLSICRRTLVSVRVSNRWHDDHQRLTSR